MKISEIAKEFMLGVIEGESVQAIADKLAYSERLMISVDFQVLQEILISDVQSLLDRCKSQAADTAVAN